MFPKHFYFISWLLVVLFSLDLSMLERVSPPFNIIITIELLFSITSSHTHNLFANGSEVDFNK